MAFTISQNCLVYGDKIRPTLYRISYLCIPRNETVRPHSQFLHSCICERFIYSQDRSAYSAAAK